MAYADEVDIDAILGPSFTVSASSNPSATQVALFLAGIDAEIRSALQYAGYAASPTSEPATTELRRLTALGTAAQVLITAFPQDTGPASNGAGAILWKAYQARLAEMRKGIGLPGGLSPTVSTINVPVTFFTQNGAIGADDAEDSWGETINAAPAFTRDMVL